ncbi:hypothetical protein [Mycobacterium syngnathidarum]|uniref:hypothetical protein n=1 Tax=Mycobacterium syngnathidarum TaxID=1908205 RepID=UPI000A425D31|nr:hypothetical protein [Mycobacterium syngnathidarum]
MSTSVRSYLVAGAAAATATAIALTPVQAAPADIAVPAHPTSAEPQLTQAMIDLLAAASRMTAAVTPKVPDQTGAAPALGFAPAAATTGEVGVQNAASDWLTSGYQFIQAWVDWGVEYAQDIAYWLGGWGVPFAGLIGDQIGIFYNYLIEPIANAVFYDAIVPIVNNPLNLGVWINGIGSAIGSSVAEAVNFGVEEFNYFFGWIFPPLPPPFPTLATTQTLAAAPGALFPGVRELVGDVVLPPADLITNVAVNTVDGAYNVVHNAADFVVGGAENALDALRLNFISRQIDINYTLISALSQQGVDLTTDLMQVPDRYLNDVLTQNQGILEALGTEARFVGNSITSHGSNALNAVGEYVDNQIDYFTPGRLATDTDTKEVTSVPPSARASLVSTPAPTETPAETPAGDVDTVAGAAQDRAKDRAARVRTRVQAGVEEAVTASRKASDDTRDAVRNTVRNLTPKPKTKATPKANEKASTAAGSQSADKGKSGSAKKGTKKDKK